MSDTGAVRLANLEALVDQNLVNQIQVDDEPRFTLLETIREYASEKLRDSGEAGALRARHLNVYLQLAETAMPELAGNHQAEWLNHLEREHDNLRAALNWALASGAVEPALRLSAALGFFWNMRGYLSEGREWLARALKAGAAPAQDTSKEFQTHYARAQLEAGRLAFVRGDYAQASDLIQECVRRFRAIDEQGGLADSFNLLGVIARQQGDYARARKLYEESLTLRRAIHDQLGVAQSLNNLGTIARIQGDLRLAHRYYKDSLALARELENRAGMALSLNSLGDLATRQGDYALARQLLEESLKLRRELGYRMGIAGTLNNLGNVALAEGDLPKRGDSAKQV